MRLSVSNFPARMHVIYDSRPKIRSNICRFSESTKKRCLSSSKSEKAAHEVSTLSPTQIKVLLDLAKRLDLSDAPVSDATTSDSRQQAGGLVFSKKLNPGKKPPLEIARLRAPKPPQISALKACRIRRCIQWFSEAEHRHPVTARFSVAFLIASLVALIAVILFSSKSWNLPWVEDDVGTHLTKPMDAGRNSLLEFLTRHSGFSHARANGFHLSSMIPQKYVDRFQPLVIVHSGENLLNCGERAAFHEVDYPLLKSLSKDTLHRGFLNHAFF